VHARRAQQGPTHDVCTPINKYLGCARRPTECMYRDFHEKRFPRLESDSLGAHSVRFTDSRAHGVERAGRSQRIATCSGAIIPPVPSKSCAVTFKIMQLTAMPSTLFNILIAFLSQLEYPLQLKMLKTKHDFKHFCLLYAGGTGAIINFHTVDLQHQLICYFPLRMISANPYERSQLLALVKNRRNSTSKL
jgi:hypothetical protein